MTVLEREFASGHTLAVAVGRRRRRRRRRGCGGRRSVARFVGVCGWRGDRARVALGIRWRLGLGVGRRRGVEQLLPVLEQRLGQTAELVRVAALAQVVEHDADALGELFEEREIRRREGVERGQFDDGLDVPFEKQRQHHDARRAGVPEAGTNPGVVGGHVAQDDPLLVHGTLADEPLAGHDSLRLARPLRVPGEEP